MFGYVNLMLIELLMIKLHAQDVYIYMYTLCFRLKLMKNYVVVDDLLMNS